MTTPKSAYCSIWHHNNLFFRNALPENKNRGCKFFLVSCNPGPVWGGKVESVREYILTIEKIKGKKPDYNISGSIAGCKIEKNNLVLPVRIYGFLCNCTNYSTLFYVEDNKTIIPLPEFKTVVNFMLIGG